MIVFTNNSDLRGASAPAPVVMILDDGIPAATFDYPQKGITTAFFKGFDLRASGGRASTMMAGATLSRIRHPSTKPIVASAAAPSDDDPLMAKRFDQFYTRREVAAYLYQIFKRYYDPKKFFMIEPSAGNGAFFDLLPVAKIGIDIKSKHPGIWNADFLQCRVKGDVNFAVIGNPPFGTNANLAIEFFNHSAAMAQVVAFVLPRTARKMSFQNKLDRNFHLVHDEVVRDDAFLFCGKPYDVPAVFQIWERRDHERALWAVETFHPHFAFLKTREGADFTVRRTGWKAGLVMDDLDESPSTRYFIRSNAPGVRSAMIALEKDFRAAASNVGAVRSLAKSEIVALYRKLVGP